MTGSFQDETEVARLDDETWSTRLDGAWNIGDTPNGGYAASSVVRALTEATGRAAPLSMTTHFLRPTLPDVDATIRVEVVREGRLASTATASLSQDGSERLRVLAAVGEPAETATSEAATSEVATSEVASPSGSHRPEGSVELDVPPVDLPPPAECVDRADLDQGVSLPILDRLDVRIHPEHARAGSAERAVMSGWVRFADRSPPTATALALFADAFPPSLLPLVVRVGWVPTIELTVHVRRHPSDGWIRASFECDDLVGDRLVESGTLWDGTGAVVARSRQLGLRRDR